jgi:PKD repeat protein
MKKILLSAVSILLTAYGYAQCMMYPVLLNERIQNSNLVIEGKVIDKVSFWNNQHNKIFTSNLVEVYKAFKGNSPAYIEVITEGGIVGDKMHKIEPSLQLRKEELGVFTLIPNSELSQFGKAVYEAYASAQGFIKYDVYDNTASEPFKKYENISTTLYDLIDSYTQSTHIDVKPTNLFQTSSNNNVTIQAVAAITGFSPTTITAGTQSTLTITGTGFGTVSTPTAIGFRNADDGGSTFISPIASEIVSWTATQIQVRVPDNAGTGFVRVQGVNSIQTLTISYAHLNASSGGTNYLTKHIGQSSGGYAWTYNSGFTGSAKASFERAFQNWRCATYINWRINLSTTSISASASDNVNIITFNSTLPAGVLGNCGSYWAGCGSGASMSWYVDEIDIQFDPTPGSGSWQYGPANATGSQYDFESVVLHELGHGHQLGHVINNSNIMHYAIGNATNKRVLNATDITAGNAVMTRNTTAGGTCSNPLMTALTAGTCSLTTTLTSAMSSATAACVNQPVTFTNASSGNPTSYTWTTTGATPTTTNSVNATFTFNSAGVKTVTLTVSNGTTTSTSSGTINIQNPPSVTLTSANSTICINGGAQTLIGSPSGGTYSGTGVQSNLFLPTNAGAGTHIATYNFTNSTGCSGSATFTFNVSTCTGIEQLSLNEFNLKPNPATDYLYLELINQSLIGMSIEIYDALGKLVQKEIASEINNKIEISNLSKGIYIVRCVSKTGAQTSKRIIKD